MKVDEEQTEYVPGDDWEKRIHEDGRVMLINHKTKQITWDDTDVNTQKSFKSVFIVVIE